MRAVRSPEWLHIGLIRASGLRAYCLRDKNAISRAFTGIFPTAKINRRIRTASLSPEAL
jgi:hypothetical protein